MEKKLVALLDEFLKEEAGECDRSSMLDDCPLARLYDEFYRQYPELLKE